MTVPSWIAGRPNASLPRSEAFSGRLQCDHRRLHDGGKRSAREHLAAAAVAHRDARGVIATGVGSAVYYMTPDDPKLAFDRLGMVVAFAGVLGMAAAQRVFRDRRGCRGGSPRWQWPRWRSSGGLLVSASAGGCVRRRRLCAIG